jgi:hypothetical protein
MYQVKQLYYPRMAPYVSPWQLQIYLGNLELAKMNTKDIRNLVLEDNRAKSARHLKQNYPPAKRFKFGTKFDCIEAYWGLCKGLPFH